MTAPSIDRDTDTRLRALDAAPAHEPVEAGVRERTLQAVLSGAAAPPADVAVPWARRHPRVPRSVLIGVAASALVAAGVVVPELGGQPAFASWTATSATLTESEAAAARTACVERTGDLAEVVPGEAAPSAAALRTLIAERRGEWVALLLSATSPSRATWDVSCLARLAPGTTEPSDVDVAVSGGGGFAAPTGRQLTQGAISEFRLDRGLLGWGRGEAASFTSGEVGEDVAVVTIHAGTRNVQATVSDGRYAAWWPGRAFVPAGAGESGRGGPEPDLRYDLVLRDGTVVRDAAALRS